MKTQIMEEDFNSIISEFQEELKQFEDKKILITGASGLIASYLIDVISIFNKQLKKPCKIIAITKNKIKEDSRLSHLIEDKNIIFLTQDVGKNFDIPGKPDIIIHAASRANPTAFLDDPIDTIDANINGTRTILEYAKNNKIEQFIFFSSAEIYGNPVQEFIPTPENYNGNVDCTHPYACYLESKRMSETLCMTFFRKFNVPVKILRILLAYGPGIKDDGKVISDFFHRAIKDKEITIRDRGEAKRSFCYISDVTRAILKIIFNGKAGEPYNIANDLKDENISILDLAEKIARIAGEDIKVKPNLEAPVKKIYGVDNRMLNITKLRNLGFKPEISIEKGLEKLKRYYYEAGYI